MNLTLPEYAVTIRQLADASTRFVFEELHFSLKNRKIIISGRKVSVIDGDQTETQHHFEITNYSYRVPVFLSDGVTPKMETVDVPDDLGVVTQIIRQVTIGEFDLWGMSMMPPNWPAIELGIKVNFKLLASNPIRYVEPA